MTNSDKWVLIIEFRLSFGNLLLVDTVVYFFIFTKNRHYRLIYLAIATDIGWPERIKRKCNSGD